VLNPKKNKKIKKYNYISLYIAPIPPMIAIIPPIKGSQALFAEVTNWPIPAIIPPTIATHPPHVAIVYITPFQDVNLMKG
jgi:hypothetical protein